MVKICEVKKRDILSAMSSLGEKLGRRSGTNDEDDRVPSHGNEKSSPLETRVSSLDESASPLDGVETEEGGDSEGSIEGSAGSGTK